MDIKRASESNQNSIKNDWFKASIPRWCFTLRIATVIGYTLLYNCIA